MKYVKKGNVYRRRSWLKEHEEELWILGCFCVVFAGLVMGFIIGG